MPLKSSRMIDLQAFPEEMFDAIIDQLVITIGIQKAVLLRTVNRAFDASILQAITVRQVVDFQHPATRHMEDRISPTLRGKIIAVQARSAYNSSKSYLSVVARVNQTLDTLIGAPDLEVAKARHEAIASAVNIKARQADEVNGLSNAKVEALNLLSGAAIIGDLSVLKSVLQRNEFLSGLADVNGHTPYFHSALTLAAANGHLDIVRYLLDSGARLDSVSSHGYVVGRLATLKDWNNGDPHLRFSTMNAKNDPSALRSAVRGGHTDIVHLLLHPQHRLPTSSLEYLRAIRAGVEAGRLDLIEALFGVIGSKLSDFTGLGDELIFPAVKHDRQAVVQMLLDSGVDVNVGPWRRGSPRPNGAIHIAASMGNVRMVSYLIEQGAHANSNFVPIREAALAGQEEVVELLLKHGADPVLALESAARGGQSRLMRRLLERYSDLLHTKYGWDEETAIDSLFCRALHSGNLTIMNMLVEAGLQLNGHENPRDLPLNQAKQLSIGQWLVNHLISLGAVETSQELKPRGTCNVWSREICITEHTWEWVGKY